MAGKCSVTSAEVKPGDAVVRLVYKDGGDKNLARVYLLEEEISEFELPGVRLGRWKRVIKENGLEELNPQEQILAAEDFFL